MARTVKERSAIFPDRAVFERLLSANKTIVLPVRWQRDNQKLVLNALLDIDGITEEGLELKGRAHPGRPDADVSFSLVFRNALDQGGNFDRIDWRPAHCHMNDGTAPGELAFQVIEQTHRHALALNGTAGLEAAIKANLRIAEPIEEPADFPALLDLIGTLWHIRATSSIAVPPWQDKLLLSGDSARMPRKRT